MLSRKLIAAHRVAYLFANGVLPAELDIMHTCDNPPCCNPKHLKAATTLENMRDSKAKGRHAHGERAKSKLTEAQVREIKRDYVAVHCHKTNAKELADRYGVCSGAISAIIRGDAWAHVK